MSRTGLFVSAILFSLCVAQTAQSGDMPFSVTVHMTPNLEGGPTPENMSKAIKAPNNLHSGIGNGFHVILQNISSRPQYLSDCACHGPLVNKLSFEVRKENGAVAKVICGHPPTHCSSDKCAFYTLPVAENYIINIDSQSCHWDVIGYDGGLHLSKENVEMRALFENTHSNWVKYVLY